MILEEVMLMVAIIAAILSVLISVLGYFSLIRFQEKEKTLSTDKNKLVEIDTELFLYTHSHKKKNDCVPISVVATDAEEQILKKYVR